MRGPGLAVAIALITVTAGCGGGQDHDAGPAGDPTALPSATPRTESASSESVQHFLRRWAAATKQMENTGRTKEYLKITRACDVCLTLAHNIQHRYAAGGYVHWRGLRIRSIETPPNSGGVVLYTVHADSAAMTIRDSPSRPEFHVPARRVTYLVGVMSTRKSFSVTSVTYG
jgi:hypothetical protein